MLAVETARDQMTQIKVVSQCKSIFNKDDLDHVLQRPGFSQFKFIPWHGDLGNPACANDRTKLLVRALRIHKQQSEKLRHIIVHDVSDMYYTINAFGQNLTLEYLLMCMRTRTNWDTNLFFQVGVDRFKQVIAICHDDEHKEAKSVISNLYTLLETKFGKDVHRWFTRAAKLNAESKKFDQDTNTVKNTEDDQLAEILPERNFIRSPAKVKEAFRNGLNAFDLAAFEDGEDEESFGSDNDDDDDDEEEQNEIVQFDLSEMFKSLPAVTPTPGNEDKSHHTFNTGATSTPLNIFEETNRSIGSVTTNAENASMQETGVIGDDE